MSTGLKRRTRQGGAAVCLALLTLVGCALPREFNSRQRQSRGLVLVLPGIEGKSFLNRNIAHGLNEGGVRSAIRIHDWTTGVPGSMLVNLAFEERNRREARRLAEIIKQYRRSYPDSPIHLVGHSGGGGIAVLALEQLPEGVEIEAAHLLAPALSSDYDLSVALRRARQGVINYYSERDIPLLRVGTSVFGAIDRKHGAAGGAVGFEQPEHLSPEDQRLYRSRLRQVRWTPRLSSYGADGSHVGWASRRFARTYLGELIVRNESSAALRARARIDESEKAEVSVSD